MSDLDPHSVRVDIWLWAARFFKTRSLAKQAIEGGRVEINGQPCKPSRLLRAGDCLQLKRADELFEIEVIEPSGRRGPATQAQALYREDEASISRRLAVREQRRLANAGFQAPVGRPDKRARRLIQALGDIDAM
ncbi:MAG: RNA-binding S4 domain-containing protein [Pseudomarimonas sp.]